MSFAVVIGSVILDKPTLPSDPEHTGAFNPQTLVWSKTNRVQIHEIPSPADRTCRTSTLTLWGLSLQFYVLDPLVNDEMFRLIDQIGPFPVRTYPRSMYMEIISGTCTQNAGWDDNVCYWDLKLQEVRT
jgi:hypothetical protein